jgi:hypothetical protein
MIRAAGDAGRTGSKGDGTHHMKRSVGESGIFDRDAERRWEAEGGNLGSPAARSGAGSPRQLEETAMAATMETTMATATWMRASLLTVVAGVAAMSLGCSPQSSAVAAVVKDKVYSVTPTSLTVKAGIVSAQVTEMKVTEGVEQGSGRIVSPARLTGKLVIKNVSTDQTVRLIGGKIAYIDAGGNRIKLEDNRNEPTVAGSSSYSSSDRLDPGQEATQVVDGDFPAEALKAKKLKDIRLELSYIPTPFKEEKLNFAVSIGGQ